MAPAISQRGAKDRSAEIVVGGPPWDTTVSIRVTDQATTSDGEVVYQNRAVLFGKVRRGKIVFYEVHEDTHKVVDLETTWQRKESALV